MSTIKKLEKILMDAYERELVEFVAIKPDYIKVVLKDTIRAHDTLINLVKHIKDNFPDVRYFHIDSVRHTFNIYHFNELYRAQRLADQENR